MSFTSLRGILAISFKIISQSSLENSGKIFPRRLIILLLIDWDLVLDIFHKKEICSLVNSLLLYKNSRISLHLSIKAS